MKRINSVTFILHWTRTNFFEKENYSVLPRVLGFVLGGYIKILVLTCWWDDTDRQKIFLKNTVLTAISIKNSKYIQCTELD